MTIVRRLFTFMGMKVDKAGFDKADKRADLLKKGVSKIGATADGVTGKITGMIGAFAGLSAFKGLINTNVEAQKLGAQLKSVTGSAKAGAKAFADIKEFAATTPFELNNVTQAYIKLKAAGIEPTNAVMKSVGNLAAANSTTIAQAAGAITKANKGLTEELGSQLNITSQTTAKTVKLTVQGVETEVKRGGQNISNFLLGIGETKFASGMEDQMQTVGGKLSNLSDATTNFQVKIGEGGLNDAVFRLVDQIIKWISVNDHLADQIGKKLGIAIDGLGGKIKVVQENSDAAKVATAGFVGVMAVPKVVAFGLSVKATLATIAAGIVLVKLKMVGLLRTLLFMNPIVFAIAAAIAVVVDLIMFFVGGPSLIGKFVQSFAGAEGGLGGMAAALLEMKEAVTSIIKDIVGILAPAFAGIASVLGDLVGAMLDVIGAVLTPIIQIVTIIIQIVMQIVAAVLSVAAVLIKIATTILKPIIKVVIFLMKIVAFIVKLIGKLLKGILGAVLGILKSIFGAVADTFGKIFEGWSVIFNAIQEMGRMIFAPIVDAFESFIEGVKNIIRKLPAGLVPNEILLWAGVVKPSLGGPGFDTAGAGRRIHASIGANKLIDQIFSAPTLAGASKAINMHGNVQVTVNTDSSDPAAVAAASREGTTQGMTDWSSNVNSLKGTE